jgi:hypothetical protein
MPPLQEAFSDDSAASGSVSWMQVRLLALKLRARQEVWLHCAGHDFAGTDRTWLCLKSVAMLSEDTG